MAPHSSTLAWKIPWTEEAGGLQSMGSLRVGHDWATSLSLFTFMHWRRKWQPTPCSCLENPRDRGACWAAVYGVAQSWTWLKRLSSSSSVFSAIITLKRWCCNYSSIICKLVFSLPTPWITIVNKKSILEPFRSLRLKRRDSWSFRKLNTSCHKPGKVYFFKIPWWSSG